MESVSCIIQVTEPSPWGLFPSRPSRRCIHLSRLCAKPHARAAENSQIHWSAQLGQLLYEFDPERPEPFHSEFVGKCSPPTTDLHSP